MDQQIKDAQKKYQTLLSVLNKKSDRFADARLIIFVILLIVANISWQHRQFLGLLITFFLLIVFVILLIKHSKVKKEIKTYESYLTIINQYFSRLNDKWHSFPSNGYTYIDNNLAKDLNLLGPSSLFQLINISKTISGERKLATTLTNPSLSAKEITSKQQAITELTNNFAFILNYQKLLNDIPDITEKDFTIDTKLLQNKPRPLNKWPIVGLVSSCLTDFMLILSIFKVIPFKVCLIPILIQLIISYLFSYFYDEDLEMISKTSRTFSSLKNLTAYVKDQTFQSALLTKLIKNINNGFNAIVSLKKINDLDGYRHNFLTYIILNPTISLNIFVLVKYNKLIAEEKNHLSNCLDSLESLENLMSFTTISLINDTKCLPTITEETQITFQAIKHPLLNSSKCVPNDFHSDQSINIITGSNMSGKTSFMRTIAVNLILMYNGSYVTAQTFSSSLMKIFTSINIEDDILHGISTFYGELLRIKAILDYEKNNESMIIFIDEIFKGTNYNDRILGAKEIIKKLSNLNCLVLITTHDFELCEINNKKIFNYHFNEEYQGDKITFDYKIKKGMCHTTNAKYLMKKIGIITEDKK